MKKLIIVAVAIGLLFVACSKDLMNQDQTPEPEVNSTEIVCIDGVLHFPSSEKFMETVRLLTDENADLHAFEKAYGFTSMSSIIDDAINVLSEIEDEASYNTTLEAYSGILNVNSDGWVSPNIVARGYTNIINAEGVFYVDGAKYTVTPDKLVVESTDNETRSTSRESFDYFTPVTTELETKVTEDYEYTNDRYQADKRRVYARAHIIRYIVNVGAFRYDISLDFQMHMSGQKKSTFGWNSYQSIFTFEQFRFTIVQQGLSTLDFPQGQVAVSSDSRNSTYVSPECKNYYETIPVITLRYAHVETMKPPVFSTLMYRALSRGTGDCGIAVNMGYIPAPLGYVKSCR